MAFLSNLVSRQCEVSPLVLCPACLGPVEEPCYIGCQHAFCLQCVQRKSAESKCMACSNPHPFPGAQISPAKKFPENHLVSMMGKRITPSRADGALGKNVGALQNFEGVLFCEKHKSGCGYYCVTCSVPCCKECCSRGHSDHELLEYNRDPSHVAEVIQKSNTVDTMEREYRQVVVQLRELQKQQEKVHDAVKKEIGRHYEQLVRKLESNRDKLLSSIEDSLKAKRSLLQLELNTSSQRLKELNARSKNVRCWKDRSSETAVILANYNTLKRTMEGYETGLEAHKQVLNQAASVPQFQAKTNLSFGGIGERKIEILAHPSPLSPDIIPNDDELRLEWQADASGGDNGVPTGALFMPNGDLLVAYYGDKCIVKFDGHSGENKTVVCSELKGRISGMAGIMGNQLTREELRESQLNIIIPNCLTYLDGRVVFTDAKSSSIHFLDPENYYTHVASFPHLFFKRVIQGRGKVIHVHGLAAIPRTKQIAVIDKAEKLLHIVDVETMALVTSCHEGILDEPTFVHYDERSDRLLVADQSKTTSQATVKIFDISSAQFQKCMRSENIAMNPCSREVSFEGLHYSGAAITDTQGQILVANNVPGKSRICLFDAEGKFIQYYNTVRANGQARHLSFPMGLALNQSNDLLAVTGPTFGDVMVFRKK